MTQSHQVVAYGYEVEGEARDVPHLRPELAGARRCHGHRAVVGTGQSTGEVLLSLFRLG